MGAPLVRMGWRPPGLSVPLPPLSSPAPQYPETMMARNNIVGYHQQCTSIYVQVDCIYVYCFASCHKRHVKVVHT